MDLHLCPALIAAHFPMIKWPHDNDGAHGFSSGITITCVLTHCSMIPFRETIMIVSWISPLHHQTACNRMLRKSLSGQCVRIIAVCTKGRHRAKLIKMCTFGAELHQIIWFYMRCNCLIQLYCAQVFLPSESEYHKFDFLVALQVLSRLAPYCPGS